ncbi:MAG: hypothetical protein DRJ35_06295 [Thermoprotei archaeon]|nr:MAG: hypothetical protein DRJ35_06295 [Thermoprotei archaeon]
MNGKTLLGTFVILIMLTSVLAVAPVAKGEVEVNSEEAKLLRLIEKIRSGLERLKGVVSHLNDTEKKQTILGKIGEAERLLDQAEQLVNQGEIERAKDTLKEVFSLLREIAQLLGKEREFIKRFESVRRYIHIIESLRKHLNLMERIADRLERAGKDVSEVKALIQLSREYLSKSIEAAKDKNFTAAKEYLEKARETTREAYGKLKLLIEEFLSEKAPEYLARLKELFQKIKSRLENVNPKLAEKFANWARGKEQLIEALINEGKYRKALVEIRKAIGEIKRFAQHLEGFRKLYKLLAFAQTVAEKVRECNSTLADMIMEKVGQIKQAVKNRDWDRVKELSRELISLLREARSCLTVHKKE